MNEKGANNMITIYWFLILTLVAGAVVLMTSSFYKNPYDVRDAEVDILATKVADCVYFGGKVNLALMSLQGVFKQEFSDNFLEHCDLDFSAKDEFSLEQYYVSIQFARMVSKTKPEFTISAGNSNYLSDCKLEDVGNKIAKCKTKEFFMKSNNGEVYFVNITAIVANVEQNVK